VHAKQVSRSVGFSYHNAEQDMFWNRSLNWLIENYSQSYQLFYLFGRTALLKTRYEEGNKAFRLAGNINSKRKLSLAFEKNILILMAKCKDVAKRIYLRLFSR
jgi:hypothetical protein